MCNSARISSVREGALTLRFIHLRWTVMYKYILVIAAELELLESKEELLPTFQ